VQEGKSTRCTSSILPKERQEKEESAREKPQEPSYVVQTSKAELTNCRCDVHWCKPASPQGKEILDGIRTLWSCILLGAFESNLALCLEKYMGKS